LREGGNAVDAAVATALALAVTYPQAGNLGGGGFLLLSRGEEVHFLDYREVAPRGLTADKFHASSLVEAGPSVLGALSVGVPGTVAGLAAAHERFGQLSWDRVVEPAIALAERGNWLTSRQARYFELYHDTLERFPSTRRYFLDPSGTPLKPATLFCQPDLAKTLRQLAERGPSAFYAGPIADQIVAEIASHGGVLDREDLAGYQAKWRDPLSLTFQGRKVFSPALPSAGGGVVNLCLGFLETLGAGSLPPDSVERLELYGRVFRLAFAIRGRLAGDPDHLDPVETKEVAARLGVRTSRDELERLEAEFLSHPAPIATGLQRQQANTTHFCVLDQEGNAVSNTYSLNTMFGSKLAVGGAGFLLNNCIDDFGIARDQPNWYELVQGERNQLCGGRRPVSSMTPCLVMNDGRVELVVGGSGGPRIPTLVTQIIASIVLDRMSLDEAVRRPRVHHQYQPAELIVEHRMPQATADKLVERGNTITRAPMLGIGAAIYRKIEDDQLAAVLDSRFSFE
jgi:gamma-glutamyltranspeptidase/glutathione hydrolase